MNERELRVIEECYSFSIPHDRQVREDIARLVKEIRALKSDIAFLQTTSVTQDEK